MLRKKLHNETREHETIFHLIIAYEALVKCFVECKIEKRRKKIEKIKMKGFKLITTNENKEKLV
jgi:hypothetical protein